MKHLKKFETNSAFDEFKAGDKYILPNVSYVVERNGVSFNPVEPLTYNMVDLGLPSGTLWADRNVGATSPEDAGLYFKWGDTIGYTAEQVVNGEGVFGSWSNYFDTTDDGSTFNKYNTSLTVLEASDDAATVHMGLEFRMPTAEEFNELKTYCTVTFIDLQGNEYSKSEVGSNAISFGNLKGIKFTRSGNSIFIPASGYANRSVYDVSVRSELWSSSLFKTNPICAYAFFSHLSGELYNTDAKRYTGFPVRGVCSK